ncbi:hypothetical protein ACFU3J_21940, partial [Streptomyces sp. NPDC057411]
AWEGSAAAEAWRTGYHPVEAAVRPPRGALRDAADERAYEERHFAMGGKLPAQQPGASTDASAGTGADAVTVVGG